MKPIVLKVGGSLALQPDALRALCKKINEIATVHPLVIVPGGGEFADVVRIMDAIYTLSNSASHKMAILSMDQYGLLLHDLMPETVPVYTSDEARDALETGQSPIFLPSKILFNEESLPNSWDVTSDSIALYIATCLDASKVVFVTDVDGIFTSDPKKNSNAVLISHLNSEKLLAFKARTSVDKFLPKLILKTKLICIVVNGQYPERVEAATGGQPTVSTMIYP